MNGVNVTEGSWNAAIAGQFNVPVVMMSGDDAAIAEVRKAIGNIEGGRDEADARLPLGQHDHAAGVVAVDRPARARGDLSGWAEFKPYKVPAR